MSAVPAETALVLGAIGLSLVSGLPTLARRRSEAAARLGTVLAVAAGLCGLAASALGLVSPEKVLLDAGWPVPIGRLVLVLDPLSAAFLLPVSVVFPLASVYGLGYDHGSPSRRTTVRLFAGLLAAAIATVTVARDGVLFLFAWEAMALSAFFLATVSHEEEEIRRAGYTYLAATHTGTLALVAMVLTLLATTGSTALAPLPASAPGAVVFLLALLGFGAKAGLFPLHFWLPGAHAGAPSHVSALLSGVMLKAGIYGILRVGGLLPEVSAWLAGLVLLAGAATAAFGVAQAVGQSDLKRSLAYSSVENVGVVAMGIGLALAGRSHGKPVWVLLGVAAAVFHTWVHALFKGALFLAAGAVVHATGTRAVDRMGGLLSRMPSTGLAFVAAAATAAVLPPLGAFASEWLLYAGLLRSFLDGSELWIAPVAIASLALSGALAVTAFLRLAGTVFLGEPRSEAAARATEAPATMRVPIALAAGAAAASGLSLPLVAGLLERVARAWAPGLLGASSPSLLAEAALRPLGAVLVVTALCLAAAGLLLARGPGTEATVGRPTWDCGYAEPRATMQYTGSSLAEWVAERLAPGLLAVKTSVERPARLFPSASRFASESPEPVGERILEPLLGRVADRLGSLRRLQHGHLSAYLAVPVATLLLLLLWNVAKGVGGTP